MEQRHGHEEPHCPHGQPWAHVRHQVERVHYAFPTYRGENIAAGYASAASTFAHWRASTGHDTNMLNSSYRVIGIARAYSATATYGNYWTTDFGGYVDRTIPC